VSEPIERGPAGVPGKGTPGKNLKRSCPSGTALRRYARDTARDARHPRHADALAWLEAKRVRFRDASASH